MGYKSKYLKFRGFGEQDLIMCDSCHKERGNDVHHIQFRSQGGADEPENLIILCRLCHDKAHDSRQFNNYLKQLIKKRS